MIYLRLFYEFFKTGLFAVGGGLATLPFVYDMAAQTGWFTNSELSDMIAVAQAAPGAIGVNVAAYAGFATAGVAGGVIAALGLVTPSIIVIVIVGGLMSKFRANIYVGSVLYGLRPASLGMVSAALLSMMLVAFVTLDRFNATGLWYELVSFKALALAAAVFLLMKRFKWHPAVFLLASAIVGMIFRFGS